MRYRISGEKGGEDRDSSFYPKSYPPPPPSPPPSSAPHGYSHPHPPQLPRVTGSANFSPDRDPWILFRHISGVTVKGNGMGRGEGREGRKGDGLFQLFFFFSKRGGGGGDDDM